MTPVELPRAAAVVESQFESDTASLQILRLDLPETIFSVLREDDSFRLDLSVTPRLDSGLCFSDRWSSNRMASPGKLFLLPPAENLQVRSGVGCQTAVICKLQRTMVQGCIDDTLEWTDERLEASLNVTSRAIPTLLLQLAQEARHPGLGSDVLCEAIAVQLAVALHRHFGSLHRPVRGGLPPWRLSLIEERLRNGYSTPTLAELAQLCGLSVRQLSRAFQESRRIPLGAYVAASKIERAKAMLATGVPLKGVSHQLGFSSPSSFCNAFRKSTGYTPSGFKEQMGGRLH